MSFLRTLVDAVGPKVLPDVVTYSRHTSCRSSLVPFVVPMRGHGVSTKVPGTFL